MRIGCVGAVDEQVGLKRKGSVDVIRVLLSGVEGDESACGPRLPDHQLGVRHVVDTADACPVTHLLPAFPTEDDRQAGKPGRRLTERRNTGGTSLPEISKSSCPGRDHRHDA